MTDVNALIIESEKMLAELQQTDVRQRMKDVLKRMTGRYVAKKDPLFWPAGMLLLGLTEAADPSTGSGTAKGGSGTAKGGSGTAKGGSGTEGEGAETAMEAVERYLDAWFKDGTPVVYVDDALAGYVFVRLYEMTGEARYREAAEKVYAFLLSAQKDEVRSIIYHPELGNRIIYADGAGMTALFLKSFGQTFKEEEAVRLGEVQIANFRQYGTDEESGLPYHAYDLESGEKLGIVGWGRAVGWLMMGGLDVNVSRYLREDGSFSWQLPAMDGPGDTSATGMIAWVLGPSTGSGTAKGGSGTAEDSLRSLGMTVDYLSSQVRDGRVYGSLAECIDYGQYRQVYGCYPWGQGAVLAALSRGMRQ